MTRNPDCNPAQLEVIGIAEGYHGDTLGCMDAVAPSVYNGPRQTPWYDSSGVPSYAHRIALHTHMVSSPTPSKGVFAESIIAFSPKGCIFWQFLASACTALEPGFSGHGFRKIPADTCILNCPCKVSED